MKYLTDRAEIAMAMNFGKFPVLYIDLDNRPFADVKDESDYAKGEKVRVAWDRPEKRYEGMSTKGEVYHENGRFYISQGASCLTDSFGRSDVLEMKEWANTALVHKSQKIVLVIDSSETKTCKVAMMKVSDCIDIHCSTVCRLEPITK